MSFSWVTISVTGISITALQCGQAPCLPAAAGDARMGDWQLLQRNSIVNVLAFKKEYLATGQGILFYTMGRWVSKSFMFTLTAWCMGY